MSRGLIYIMTSICGNMRNTGITANRLSSGIVMKINTGRSRNILNTTNGTDGMTGTTGTIINKF